MHGGPSLSAHLGESRGGQGGKGAGACTRPPAFAERARHRIRRARARAHSARKARRGATARRASRSSVTHRMSRSTRRPQKGLAGGGAGGRPRDAGLGARVSAARAGGAAGAEVHIPHLAAVHDFPDCWRPSDDPVPDIAAPGPTNHADSLMSAFAAVTRWSQSVEPPSGSVTPRFPGTPTATGAEDINADIASQPARWPEANPAATSAGSRVETPLRRVARGIVQDTTRPGRERERESPEGPHGDAHPPLAPAGRSTPPQRPRRSQRALPTETNLADR